MAVNVFYNYYQTENEERNSEIEFCLYKLNSNKNIDTIYVIGTDIIIKDKCRNIHLDGQPTYNYIFSVINYVTQNDDINIVLNSDCYFDEDAIDKIKNNIKENQCYCLTRWDINSDLETISLYNRIDSQDAWVFIGEIKKINADFNMGVPGCDNALCYKLDEAGYTILNPSLDIKLIHYHLTNFRNQPERINLPYKLITPSKL